MTKRKFIITLITILIFILSACSLEVDDIDSVSLSDSNPLTIHFIDVGQGDSTLIQINNKNLLIDAGSRSEGEKIKNYLKKLKIKELDYVVATHPHEDHIGGMDEIINNFDINSFIAPKVTKNTKVFKNMIIALKTKNLKITPAKAGNLIDLGEDVYCEIIAPNNSFYDDDNNYSVVIRLVYKDTSFIFQGDADSLSEREVLDNNFSISSDVIKIGHHGSKTSTTKDYLEEVSPKIAIISCGRDNRYDHPHKETLEKLKLNNVKLLRTDIEGTIILSSDGNKIYRK